MATPRRGCQDAVFKGARAKEAPNTLTKSSETLQQSVNTLDGTLLALRALFCGAHRLTSFFQGDSALNIDSRCGRRRTPALSLAAGLLIFTATMARAQSTPSPPPPQDADGNTTLTLGETVVVTGSAAPITNILTSVDILGGDVAQRENLDNAFALFARLPGVLVTNFNQATINGAFSVRGFNGEGGINAIKLLIDGIPSNTNDGYTWMIDQVFPLDIASVELVRGTSDPRYGLHNIAGNANVQTRIGGTYFDVKALSGAYGTYEGQLSAGLERGKISQNYSVGYRSSNGYRDHADFDRLSLAGKWFYTPGKFRVGAIVRYYDGSGQEPGFLTVTDAYISPRLSYPLSQTDGSDRQVGQYSLHADGELTPRLFASAKAYAGHYVDTRVVRFAEGIPGQERDVNEWQYGATTTLRYHPKVPSALHGFAVEGGADVQIQDNGYARYRTANRVRTSQVFDQSFGLSVLGTYLQTVIEPSSWLKITPAYRVDWIGGDFTDRLAGATYDVNHYGAVSQPKLSAVVSPGKGVSVYGNYGRTFQIGVGVATYKIPPRVTDLAPSLNDGWETGVKYRRGRWLESRVAVWRQTASGEVQKEDLTGDFSNLGKTRRDGFDLEARVSPSTRVTLWAAFSKQRGVIVVPDPSTPEQRGNLLDHVPEYSISAGDRRQADDEASIVASG